MHAHTILLYGLNELFIEQLYSKHEKWHTLLNDYSAVAIMCMLLLLTAV